MNRQNDTMLCDLYELTMANGYFSQGLQDQIAYFDVFFRRIPDGGGFVIAAGLEQAADYVQALRFTTEDIEYLRGLKLFSAEFLDYLRMFSFHGDIYAVPEGTPVFPQEPIAIVRAPLIEAQLLETEVRHAQLALASATRQASEIRKDVGQLRGWGIWRKDPEAIRRDLRGIIADNTRATDALTRVSNALWQGSQPTQCAPQKRDHAQDLSWDCLFSIYHTQF
jgi:hypothetical protein